MTALTLSFSPAEFFAAGVFESLRAYNGILFGLEEHLERFFESAKTVGVKIPQTRTEIQKEVRKALAESGKKEAFVRLTLVGNKISVIVTERAHPPGIYQNGVSLRTTAVRRIASQACFPEAKSTAFLNQILATLEPAPRGNDEILFLNQQGYVAEARTGNIFIVKQKRGQSPKGTVPFLATPPPYGLLNGVTRRFVIKCASLAGIRVEEIPLTRHDVWTADEVFLTNTSWEILPVAKLDGRSIGTKVPGGVTTRLHKLFKERVAQACRRKPRAAH